MKFQRLRKLSADRSGAMAVIVAACIPVFMGGIALAVDVAQWTLAKRMLQRQADSAALAGVYAIAQGADAVESATRDMGHNASYGLDGPPVIERGPSVGAFAGNPNAVRVALGTAMRLPFASLFLPEGVRVGAEATAALVSTGEACVLALENSDTAGITMGGNTVVDLNCMMVTNSVAPEAIVGFGSATIKASPVAAAGGIPEADNFAEGTVFLPYSLAQPDPYAALPDPVIPGGNGKMQVQPGKTGTFDPGTYTNVDIKGTATLNPGVYYIDGGSFDVGSQAVVNAQGVTIVLTSRNAASSPRSVAGVDINGGATLNMTASTSGAYAGILFFQDRLATNQIHKINGNAESTLQGAIYFPKSTVEFTGTMGMTINCIQMVAWRLTFNGTSNVTNVCPPDEGAKPFEGFVVRLVA
jgi:hypothetical protein